MVSRHAAPTQHRHIRRRSLGHHAQLHGVDRTQVGVLLAAQAHRPWHRGLRLHPEQTADLRGRRGSRESLLRHSRAEGFADTAHRIGVPGQREDGCTRRLLAKSAERQPGPAAAPTVPGISADDHHHADGAEQLFGNRQSERRIARGPDHRSDQRHRHAAGRRRRQHVQRAVQSRHDLVVERQSPAGAVAHLVDPGRLRRQPPEQHRPPAEPQLRSVRRGRREPAVQLDRHHIGHEHPVEPWPHGVRLGTGELQPPDVPRPADHGRVHVFEDGRLVGWFDSHSAVLVSEQE